MKKSEMAILLKNFYNQRLADFDSISETDAQQIISFLEEHDMLPPYNGPVGSGDFDECSCQVISIS